ncbi:MAG: DinB family protein [Acidobacteriota bacterium]
MFTRELITDLFRHMEWADRTVWAKLPDGDAPDERLRHLLVHLHMVQRAFLHIWTDRSVAAVFRKANSFDTLADVRAWASPYYAEAHEFLSAVRAEHLTTRVMLPWADRLTEKFGREPEPTTLGETCFQVASHSTYHRGQVNARLRELGMEPPLVDYIAWVWFGRPALGDA